MLSVNLVLGGNFTRKKKSFALMFSGAFFPLDHRTERKLKERKEKTADIENTDMSAVRCD
jgi:hypothetical protein